MLFSGKIPFHVAVRLTPRFWVPYLLRFATIRHYSRRFAIIRSIRTIRYSGLFGIRNSGFPDTRILWPFNYGHAKLMRLNKAETAVHGCHCPGDIALRMRKVLAWPWIGVECHLRLLLFRHFFANFDTFKWLYLSQN